jgi:hypothetical protein
VKTEPAFVSATSQQPSTLCHFQENRPDFEMKQQSIDENKKDNAQKITWETYG